MSNLNSALSLLKNAGVMPTKPYRNARTSKKCKRRLNLDSVSKAFQSCGWRVNIVERREPIKKKTSNLFGCINIIAIKSSSKGALGLLVMQANNLEHAFSRIEESPEAKVWLAARNRIVIVLLNDFRMKMYEVTKETLPAKGVIEFRPEI